MKRGFVCLSVMLVIWIWLVLPLLVVPAFLDHSLGAKSLGIIAALAVVLLWDAFGKGFLTRAAKCPLAEAPRECDHLALQGQPNPRHLDSDRQQQTVLARSPWRALGALGILVGGSWGLRYTDAGAYKMAALAAAAILGGWAALRIRPDVWFKGAAIGGVLIGLMGLMQIAFSGSMFEPASDPGQFPAVTMGNRGLASLVVALGLYPLWVWGRLTLGWHRWLWWACLGVMGLFIALTMTRSVWLGIALAIGWQVLRLQGWQRLVAFGRRRWRQLILAAGVAALLVGGLAAMNEALWVLLQHRLDPQNWLNNPRFALWVDVCLGFYRQGPIAWLTGMGPGAFFEVSRFWHPGDRPYLDAHNDLLQWLVEFGVLAVMIVVVLLVRALRAAADGSKLPNGGESGMWRRCCDYHLVCLVGCGLLFYPLQLGFFVLAFSYALVAKLLGGGLGGESASGGQSSPIRSPMAVYVAGARRLVIGLMGGVLLVVCVGRGYLEFHMGILAREALTPSARVYHSRAVQDVSRFVGMPGYYRRFLTFTGGS